MSVKLKVIREVILLLANMNDLCKIARLIIIMINKEKNPHRGEKNPSTLND